MRLILASSSPRRKEVMDKMGLDYEIIPSNFEENHSLHTNAIDLVEDFAIQKAADIFEKYTDAAVIGSDTIVLDPEGKLLGKPKTKDDAFGMVKSLQGKKSFVYTGVALLAPGKQYVGHKEASIFFKQMDDKQIQDYLDDPQADWMDKAGAYALQGRAATWIEGYEGEYSAILGLSEELVRQFLSELDKSVA
ncbi:MAG: septum formation protein Maf [Candidatus Magasanikbacteria bacterium CG11_big_fil_rev_8_21_14_0_20_39_34]|uniref:dTTP/UTP pyrophosphatase n=1 Tax=Candidatus Magasanikbacteria bacterium CG11_big_fil_rev_8_21_14_0_20_39_34 TaxID=1974653 RepID=A0A2H0N6X0_9BACT|nr:MAG: septum formation protein Maf [Candidatus Magasanikbacteria bacterium CG11_big_fil_rev_8_21_14_0_20_39_34]